MSLKGQGSVRRALVVVIRNDTVITIARISFPHAIPSIHRTEDIHFVIQFNGQCAFALVDDLPPSVDEYLA